MNYFQIDEKAKLERIVPIALELKQFLQAKRSPLQPQIMTFFGSLLQEYRKPLSGGCCKNVTVTLLEIFDSKLLAELEYDAKHQRTQAVATVKVPNY